MYEQGFEFALSQLTFLLEACLLQRFEKQKEKKELPQIFVKLTKKKVAFKICKTGKKKFAQRFVKQENSRGGEWFT